MIEALKSDEIVRKVGGRFKLTALIQKRMLELMDGAGWWSRRHRLMAGALVVGVRALASVLEAEQVDPSGRTSAFKRAECACQAALKHSRVDRLARPEAMRLQGTCEWLRGRTDAARTWWERSAALAESMGMRYDLGMAHLEMGKRLGERVQMERAEAILVEVGTV